MLALELKAEDPEYFSGLKPRLYRFFLEHGVLLRPLGHVIYILPPYCISIQDLNYIYDVSDEALRNYLLPCGNANPRL